MITSLNAEKVVDKIQHFFMTEIQKNLGIQRIYLNIMKEIYKYITIFMLNRYKFNAFSPNAEAKQGCPFFPFLFNAILKFLEL